MIYVTQYARMQINHGIINRFEKYLIMENIAITIKRYYQGRSISNSLTTLKQLPCILCGKLRIDYIRISLQYNMIGPIMHNHL